MMQVEVGGREAEFPPALIAIDYGAQDADRAAEHGGGLLEVTELHRLADEAARHRASLEAQWWHLGDREAEALRQRAQALGIAAAVASELGVETEHEFA